MNATLVLALVIAALAAIAITIHHDIIRTIERNTMSINVNVQATIDAAVAQLTKAHRELADRLEAATLGIQAQLVEAGVAEQVDLSALTAIAQQIDDLVPDAVVDPAVDPEVDEVDEVEVDEVDEGEVDEVDEVEVDDDTDTVEVTDEESGDEEDDE
jgi:hypothetical protein